MWDDNCDVRIATNNSDINHGIQDMFLPSTQQITRAVEDPGVPSCGESPTRSSGRSQTDAAANFSDIGAALVLPREGGGGGGGNASSRTGPFHLDSYDKCQIAMWRADDVSSPVATVEQIGSSTSSGSHADTRGSQGAPQSGGSTRNRPQTRSQSGIVKPKQFTNGPIR